VSLQKCSGCQERQPGKYANVTVAWWNAKNDRLAYRLKVCSVCWMTNLDELRLSVSTDEFSCPYCHTNPGDDIDPTYVTAFIPNVGKLQLEMATCAVDAVQLRVWAQDHGERLGDNPVGGQGPSPQTPAPSWDEWLSAGINTGGR
jgi:hypothetical protein